MYQRYCFVGQTRLTLIFSILEAQTIKVTITLLHRIKNNPSSLKSKIGDGDRKALIIYFIDSNIPRALEFTKGPPYPYKLNLAGHRQLEHRAPPVSRAFTQTARLAAKLMLRCISA